MATVLNDYTDKGYDILREMVPDGSSTTSAYPLTLMQGFMNTAQNKICNGLVMNPLNGMEERAGQLPFMNGDAFYSNVQMTTLDDDLAIGDTVVTVASTADYPSSGVLFIAGNIVTYSAKTSTTFTGVPATGTGSVAFAWQTGTPVSIAFALPADYGSVLNITYNNTFKVLPQLYDSIFENLMQYKLSGYNRGQRTEGMTQQRFIGQTFYTIKDNQYLIMFNLNNNDSPIRLRYRKVATYMSSGVTPGTITNDTYAMSTIPYLGVAEMLYNRGEEERAAQIYNFALGNIHEMYTFYDNTMYEEISGTRYKTGKKVMNF